MQSVAVLLTSCGAACGAERVTIAPHRPSPLMPPGGLVYSSFPALILVEHGDGQGLRLRRTSNNSKKRQSVGRRRAISELMVRRTPDYIAGLAAC